MRGIPALIAFGVVAAALAVSGQTEPKPAEAAEAAAASQPTPLTEAQFAELQSALKRVRDAENELNALYERLKESEASWDAERRMLRDERDRALINKQSSLTPAASPPVSAPRAVTYVSAGARGVCANGSCGQGRVYYVPRQTAKQEPVQYQARGRFRDGTGWRPGKILLGR